MTGFLATTRIDGSVDGGDAAGEAADGAGLSLREAVALADAAPGEDVIRFAAGLDGALIRLVLGEIRASEALTIEGDIDGDGLADITLSGDTAGDDVTDAQGLTDIAASRAAGRLDDNPRVLALEGGRRIAGLAVTGGSTPGGALEGGGRAARRRRRLGRRELRQRTRRHRPRDRGQRRGEQVLRWRRDRLSGRQRARAVAARSRPSHWRTGPTRPSTPRRAA